MSAKALGDQPVGASPGQPWQRDGELLHPYSGNGWMVEPQPGITLRQHFAGLAMQALASIPLSGEQRGAVLAGDAAWAVAYADALLAELAKAQP